MSRKSKRITTGILSIGLSSLFVLSVMAIFYVFFVEGLFLFNIVNLMTLFIPYLLGWNPINPETLERFIFLLYFIPSVLFASIPLVIAYIVDAFRNKRIAWGVCLILFNIFIIPFYWRKYIFKEVKT
jgi:hypothetical protein